MLECTQLNLPSFDVLVFAPDRMPAVPGGTAPPPRVWRDWRPLTLNPYVAFAAALPLLHAPVAGAGADDPDPLGAVPAECLRVRAAWDGVGAGA